MNSPPHRANVLARGWGEVGIGVAAGTLEGFGNAATYTVNFGTRG